MRKIISIVLLAIFMISTFPIETSYAIDNESEEKINLANKYIKDKFKLDKYYKLENMEGKLINEKYIKNGIVSPNYPVFVYGSDQQASIDSGSSPTKKGSEYRCIGYTYDDQLFSNPNFEADYPMTPYLENKKFVKEPWNRNDISLVKKFLRDEASKFDAEKIKETENKSIFRDSIKYGIGLAYGIYKDSTIGTTTEAQCRQYIRMGDSR